MATLPPLIRSLASGLHPVSLIPSDDGSPLRPAGVMVLLFPREGDVRILLTQRPESLARHPGQISLPGGRAEDHDLSLLHTAIRETREELGIKTGRLVPLGRLDPVPVAVSNYLIWPFVAWSPVAPRIRADPREVAEVLEVSLTDLLDPGTVRQEEWEFRGSSWQVTFYRFGTVTVWGATARILSDLASRLEPRLPRADPLPGDVLKVGEI